MGKFNDAYQISQYADATLFVVKAEHTLKADVVECQKKSLPQLLFVLNGIDMSKKKYKYLNN
jgi:GTPase Era involved in 16S rRNA processing